MLKDCYLEFSDKRPRRSGTTQVFAWLQILILLLGVSGAAFAKTPRTVIVGSPGNRPIAFTDSSNRWIGLSVTVLDEIAAQEGWTIKRVTAPWRELLKKLGNGEIDLLEGITYATKRAKLFEFSNESLMKNWGVIYAPMGTSISSFPDLDGKTVAVSGRSPHTEALMRLAKEFGVNFRPLAKPGFSRVFDALSQGKADAGLVSRTFGLGQGESFGLLPTPIVIDPSEVRYAAPKGTNRDILAAIDRYLVAAKSEPSSAYNRALEQWLGGGVDTGIPNWLVATVLISVLSLIFTVIFILVLRAQLKKRTSELTRSETLLRSIVDHAPASIVLIDVDGRYLLANNAFALPRGATPEGLIGRIPRNTSAEHAAAAGAHNTMVIESGETVVEERNAILPDGSPYHALITKFPIFDGKGQLASIGSIGIDIADLRQAESALRESEEQTRMAFDAMPIMVAYLDSNERYIMVNAKACEWFARPAVEIVGKSIEEIHGAEYKNLKPTIDRVLVGETVALEGSMTFPDGVTRDIRTNTTPKFDDDNAVLGWVVMVEDITEQKKAEAQTQRSEALLRAIVDNSPSEISLRDANGKFILVNETFLKQRGETQASTIGKTPYDFVPRERADLVTQIDRQVIEGKEALTGEIDITLPDNSFFPVMWTKFPVYLKDGELLGVGTIATDNTDLRNALDEARDANKAKQDFLANMSHELRTPMNAIIGFSDVMGLQLFGPLGNNRYLDYAHDISRSAQHLLELINDVLDISKIEAGKHELSITGIDLAVIATEAVRELQGQMREKSLHFNFDVDRNAASIRADGTAIRQMLTNLLSNAVKFTPENGDIMLSITTVKSGTVKITISDTGIGIPEEDIEKVLTPFGQSGDIELAREGGTGLGLPIVNALAKLHGGTFDIESVIGVGTQAHITLPRTPDPGSAEADSAGQGAR